MSNIMSSPSILACSQREFETFPHVGHYFLHRLHVCEGGAEFDKGIEFPCDEATAVGRFHEFPASEGIVRLLYMENLNGEPRRMARAEGWM